MRNKMPLCSENTHIPSSPVFLYITRGVLRCLLDIDTLRYVIFEVLSQRYSLCGPARYQSPKSVREDLVIYLVF